MRRVLPPVIVSQLISDYISATRCSMVPHNAHPVFPGTRRTVVLRKSPPVISWLKYAVAHATNIGLYQCTDKNMIPTCAQSSAACDWLTINFWLYFSYTMFHSATQCLSSFSTTQEWGSPSMVPHNASPIYSGTRAWGSPCEKCLSQCTDKNMIPLVRRVLPPVIGSQLISDDTSAARCSMVPHNASPIFSTTQV